MNRFEIVKMGEVGVDSGQLMIVDPCYLDGPEGWKNEAFRLDENNDPEANEEPFSYAGICNLTLSDPGYGKVDYDMGHSGRAVAFRSGFGDGIYEVYGVIGDEGQYGKRILGMFVNMGIEPIEIIDIAELLEKKMLQEESE